MPRSTSKGEKKNWLRRVKTVSTAPPTGLFTRDAKTIARTMASRKVSPKGIGSAILRIQFQINRSGRALSRARRAELERAKRILQERRSSPGRSSSTGGSKRT
jgi:tRNA(adenine34) deaminase